MASGRVSLAAAATTPISTRPVAGVKRAASWGPPCPRRDAGRAAQRVDDGSTAFRAPAGPGLFHGPPCAGCIRQMTARAAGAFARVRAGLTSAAARVPKTSGWRPACGDGPTRGRAFCIHRGGACERGWRCRIGRSVAQGDARPRPTHALLRARPPRASAVRSPDPVDARPIALCPP